MTTTAQAVYDEGVLRLRRRLPLAPHSEVSVTVELPDSAGTGGAAVATPVVWPDLAARLGAEARTRMVAGYDLKTVCLPEQLAWLDAVAAGG